MRVPLTLVICPAGIWTGAFFIVFGIFAKLSAFFVSIPDCLNGGLLIIIAAIVMGPGVRVSTIASHICAAPCSTALPVYMRSLGSQLVLANVLLGVEVYPLVFAHTLTCCFCICRC